MFGSFSNSCLEILEGLFCHLLSLEELIDDSFNGVLGGFISLSKILIELPNNHLPEVLSLLNSFGLLDS